jgi:hypothetical protein
MQESPLKIKTTVEEMLSRIPGPATVEWPTGERFAVGLAHGSMSVEYYAPVGNDLQTPHEQDEVYFIHKGTGALVIAEERYSFEAGDCLLQLMSSTGSKIFPVTLAHGWYFGDLKAAKGVEKTLKVAYA